MNADELNPKPAEPVLATAGTESASRGAEARQQAAPKRSAAVIALLALLLAALSLAAAAWMWWQSGAAQQRQTTQLQMQQQQYQAGLQRLEQELASVQDSVNQQSSSQGTARINELSGELQGRLQTLEAMQAANEDFRSETGAWTRSAQAALEGTQTRLNTVDERLRTLTARSAQSNSELELEEIDYLLRMAQERLQLFGDTRNADRALQLADHQVVAFDNPMFIALRREIAAARQALAAADVPDMATLAAELDKIQDSLATLPFKTSDHESGVQPGNNVTDPSWWQRLKNSLSGLITVRRVTEDEQALPVMADQQALRQRAWLQIEQARLAGFSREQVIYLDALSQAEATINRWFATDNPQVKLSLSGLQALQQRNVNPPMPDISGPSNTLRSIRGVGLSPLMDSGMSPAGAPAGNADTLNRSVDKPGAEPVAKTGAETGQEAVDESVNEPGDDLGNQPGDGSGFEAAAESVSTDGPLDSNQ